MRRSDSHDSDRPPSYRWKAPPRWSRVETGSLRFRYASLSPCHALGLRRSVDLSPSRCRRCWLPSRSKGRHRDLLFRAELLWEHAALPAAAENSLCTLRMFRSVKNWLHSPFSFFNTYTHATLGRGGWLGLPQRVSHPSRRALGFASRANAGDDWPPSAVKRGNWKRLKGASNGPVDRLVIFA